MIKVTNLTEFYSLVKKDSIFITFYNSVTEKCPIHNPIMNSYKPVTNSLKIDNIVAYLFKIPNLFKKMKLTNLLVSYHKFRKRKTFSIQSKRKSVTIAKYILLQGIVSMEDYKTDSDEEIYSRCKPIFDEINKSDLKNNDELNIPPLILKTITPFVKSLCKCKRPFGNCEIINLNYNFPSDRLDLIEKAIWETELNSYFYFMNLYVKIRIATIKKTQSNKVSFSGTLVDICSLDEKLKCRIFDYFQHENNDGINGKCFIYTIGTGLLTSNNSFISPDKLSYIAKKEKIRIGYIESPPYCFVCEKYDIKIKYELSADKFVCNKTNKAVKGFTCVICKKKISENLNINCTEIITNYKPNYYSESEEESLCDDSEDNSDEHSEFARQLAIKNRFISYFEQRRHKQLMIIMAQLFDFESVFAIFPIEIIYCIIFPFYWEPINALQDNLIEIDNTKIMYSQYRSIIGAKKIEK